MSFANQVAVITGASSGIGWELAKQLAQQGCVVGLVARRQERLAQLVQEIHAAGGKAAYAVADVAKRAETVAAIHSLRDQLGPIDLMIANSGVGVPTTIEPMNIDEVVQSFEVNTLGVVYAIEAVLPEMLQRGKGHLVAMSSLAAHLAIPGESAYCASKNAVNVFMDSLRLQLRGRGIYVTTLCPGFILTPMTEVNTFHMPYLMNVDYATRLMLRAIARKKKTYNFPWQLTFLIKAARWLPDWLLVRIFAGKSGERPKPKI